MVRQRCGMTTHGFVQSLDLTKMMLSADVLGAAGGEKIECPSQHHFPCLNTCLNTSVLVSTPVDHHLSPRLNTWLLNAESCRVSLVNRRPCPARRNAELREPSGSGAAALVCASALCASWLSVLKYFALYRVHRGDAQK